MGGYGSRLSVPDELRDLKYKPKDCERYAKLRRDYAAFLEKQEAITQKRLEMNTPKGRLRDYEIIGVLGKGGYGQFFEIRHRETRQELGMKVLNKAFLLKNFCSERAIREKELMFALSFEFLLPAICSFQDLYNLYIVAPLAIFGDLTALTDGEKCAVIDEVTVKYVTAQIVLGVEFLHANKIVHRDLKPQNILIFDDFYIKVADLGLAKKNERKKEHAFKLHGRMYHVMGTPGYIAPEMFLKNGYGLAVDWYSLGIIVFELLYHKHPFVVRKNGAKKANKKKEFFKILPLSFPDYENENEIKNKFIAGLLQPDPVKRTGGYERGASDVKDHCWFFELDFYYILNKQVKFEGSFTRVQPDNTKKKDYDDYYENPPEYPGVHEFIRWDK